MLIPKENFILIEPPNVKIGDYFTDKSDLSLIHKITNIEHNNIVTEYQTIENYRNKVCEFSSLNMTFGDLLRLHYKFYNVPIKNWKNRLE